jgi:hypothetical protein
MRTIVIYESLTGHTRTAAGLIANGLIRAGHPATVCPTSAIDLQALAEADLVVIGTWTDGAIFIGQRPGGARRLRKLPALAGKRCVVFVTYAIDHGPVLAKLSALVAERGGEVAGAMAIRRNRLEAGAQELVDRLLGAVAA